ncbi:MAG: hypothetical protein V2I97_05390 [Desulfococcaceae bacterium]|jgi:hypothetical protein|nr:hypothetical protein [Desulfococcaceae bacterium]
MTLKENTYRNLKKKVLVLLQGDNPEHTLQEIRQYPARQIIGPLFSHFYHGDEHTRWAAIMAMGAVVDGMVRAGDTESARVVMRRLMWNLNDESGGIGWGSPEAMGEITARNRTMAKEFHRILTSYACEEGNFLEHEVLQYGVLWGIGRLAHARPELIPYALPWLLPFLKSPDPGHRGLAAWAAAPIADAEGLRQIRNLADDSTEIRIFIKGHLQNKSISSLIKEILPPSGSE